MMDEDLRNDKITASVKYLDKIFDTQWKMYPWYTRMWINKKSAKTWFMEGAANGMAQIIRELRGR